MLIKSLKMQNNSIECWTVKDNRLYRKIATECNYVYDYKSVGIEEICSRIRVIKNLIEQGKESNKMILLLGLDSVLTEMSHGFIGIPSGVKEQEASAVLDAPIANEKRDGGMDLNALLDFMFDEEEDSNEADEDGSEGALNSWEEEKIEEVKSVSSDEMIENQIYDAREDLQFILTHGPKRGYHFMMVCDSVTEFERAGVSSTLFKHKIIFRTARSEAINIVSSACGSVVAELKDHIYRYTNGLDEISFRPYLHFGITIDGWSISGGEVTNMVAEEEEYLM